LACDRVKPTNICLDELNIFTKQATSSLIVGFPTEIHLSEYKFNFVL